MGSKSSTQHSTAVRVLWTVVVTLMLVVSAMVVSASRASATEVQEQYMVTAWEMPSWVDDRTAVWPQKLHSNVIVTSKDGALDRAEIVAKCGYFQIDVYKYMTEADRANVDNLIAGGVLKAPDNPYDEPLIKGGYGKAWTFLNLGTCETTTPTPTPTPSTTSPTPTPSESTTTPTPTPTTPVPSTTEPQTSPPATSHTPEEPPTTPSDECMTGCLADTGSSALPLGAAGLLIASVGAGAALLSRKVGRHA